MQSIDKKRKGIPLLALLSSMFVMYGSMVFAQQHQKNALLANELLEENNWISLQFAEAGKRIMYDGTENVVRRRRIVLIVGQGC